MELRGRGWGNERTVGLRFVSQSRVVRSLVKITQVNAKFELRYESLKSKLSLILFAYKLMIR